MDTISLLFFKRTRPFIVFFMSLASSFSPCIIHAYMHLLPNLTVSSTCMIAFIILLEFHIFRTEFVWCHRRFFSFSTPSTTAVLTSGHAHTHGAAFWQEKKEGERRRGVFMIHCFGLPVPVGSNLCLMHQPHALSTPLPSFLSLVYPFFRGVHQMIDMHRVSANQSKQKQSTFVSLEELKY